MKTFRIRYYECYEGFYEVEADNKEEAEEVLKQRILDGKEDAPAICFDSGVGLEEE